MLVFLLALVAIEGDGAALPAPAGPPAVGDRAPALTVDTPDGRSLSAIGDGEIVVVDFFATWCKPCHRAQRDLVAIGDALGGRVRFVLVDGGETAEEVRAYLAQSPPPAGTKVMIDPGGQIMRRWGARSFPTAFLVDRDGVVRRINRGWGPGYQARMLRWLREMLGDVPAREDRRARGAARPAEPAPPAREVVKGVEILRGP